MNNAPKKLDSLFLRIGALAAHALLNIIIVAYLTRYDLTGSWLAFAGFLLSFVVLLFFFIRHIISFINFIKK